MKNEIEAAIQALKNGDNQNEDDNKPDKTPNDNQKSLSKNNSSDKIPWKIIILISLFVLFLLIAGAVIFRKRKKR